MRKLLLLLLLATAAHARQRLNGWCEQGGQAVQTQGSHNSTTKVQRSYPGCTITVYVTGTLTLASIFSDNSGTVLANPFTANATNGSWFFYASDGVYDVKESGASMATAFTYGGIQFLTSTGGGGGTPGGNTGQVQWNNNGIFAGFTVSGDATLVASSGALTLATVNTNTGTCGDATHVGQVTLNAKGLVTACTAVAISAGAGNPGGSSGQSQYNNSGVFGGYTMSGDATLVTSTGVITVTKTSGTVFAPSATTNALVASNISSGTLPAGRMPALTGDITTSAGAVATTLATVNSNVGACGDATHVAQVTLTAKGLATACTPVAITSTNASPWSALTAPAGNLALTMAAYTTTWTYNGTTGASVNLMTVTDTASNTGTGILAKFTTANGSAATPWQADANGVGYKVAADGSLQSVGTSAGWVGTLGVGTAPASPAAGNIKLYANSTDLKPHSKDATGLDIALGHFVDVNKQTGTSYTFLTGDRGKLVTQTNGSAIADTLPACTSAGFPDGWYVYVTNYGAGTATITPTTSTINGAATLALTTGLRAMIVCYGTDGNYYSN